MDSKFKFGDYEFVMLTEADFADFKAVSESAEPRRQAQLFQWALSKQAWFFLYIVRYQGEVIGRVESKVINHAVPFYEIGLEVKSEYRNLGHGEQMIKHVVSYLKNTCFAKRIHGVVNVDNKASNALFRKTELLLECTLKNYGVTIESDPCDSNIYSVIF